MSTISSADGSPPLLLLVLASSPHPPPLLLLSFCSLNLALLARHHLYSRRKKLESLLKFRYWERRVLSDDVFSLVDKRAWKCSLDDYGDKGALSKLAP